LHALEASTPVSPLPDPSELTPRHRPLAAGVVAKHGKNNGPRIPTYRATYAEDPAAFVQSERDRTEAFIKWYPYTMYSFSVVIIIGLAVFLWRPTPLGRAIGLATVILGLGVLFLDHFSEERADGYHTQILQELEQRPVPPSF